MKLAPLPLLPLLAACGGTGEGEEDRIQTADLTGLYEGQGPTVERDRLCMRTEPSGEVRFGIVTMGAGRAACSGLGQVVRSENALRLTMVGDEECELAAQMDGTQLSFASPVPESCAYYCGEGATFAGRRFEKTGDTGEAALQAADLVGDPLCG